MKQSGKINLPGRPKGKKDTGPPRWETKTQWKDNSIDIMSAANAQFAQHGQVTLQYVANMTGKSKNRICQILKRFNWSFYLYQYSVHLTEDQKIRRMEMARQFENRIHTDPNYLNRIWFSDESYFVVGLRKPGRCGTFLPPCECEKDPNDPCTCAHSSQRDVPVVKNPQKVWKIIRFTQSK